MFPNDNVVIINPAAKRNSIQLFALFICLCSFCSLIMVYHTPMIERSMRAIPMISIIFILMCSFSEWKRDRCGQKGPLL